MYCNNSVFFMYFVYLYIYDLTQHSAVILANFSICGMYVYMCVCVCVCVCACARVHMCVIIIALNNNKQPTTLHDDDKVHKADDSRLFHSASHMFLNSNVNIIHVFVIKNYMNKISWY
jgi:hypothetical protein